MNKKSLLAILMLIICQTQLTANQSQSKDTKSINKKPNFIIFFTDDQGFNDVGCFGSPNLKTPNLDQMAKEGLKLTSFYAQPVCGPSRAALMTGCYPIRVAEPNNKKNQHTHLHTKELTIAEVLKSAGYATGIIGKWHIGGKKRTKEISPNGQGFDYFYGTPTHNGYTRIVNHKSFKTMIMRNQTVLVEALTQEGMNNLTQDYTKESVKFIKENKDKPFFLYLAHNMPHVPLGASDNFRGKSARGLYGDVIEELDWSMGEVLKTLKEVGIDDNTFIIFTSDNGPWIDKRIRDYAGSAAPLRGWKMSAWEGGPRVPCIMRWPGKIPAGSESNELLSTMDILPTFAHLAKAPLDKSIKIDGLNAWDFINGKSSKSPRDSFFTYNFLRLNAIRKGKWKLVPPRKAKAEGTGWSSRNIDAVSDFELYDIDKDMAEKNNVANNHPEIVEKLKKLLESTRTELGDWNKRGTGARFFDGALPDDSYSSRKGK